MIRLETAYEEINTVGGKILSIQAMKEGFFRIKIINDGVISEVLLTHPNMDELLGAIYRAYDIQRKVG
jgi:hypothetical protein